MPDDIFDPGKGASYDPEIAAQKAMRKALPRKFYKQVSVCGEGSGFAVHLDGRPLRTPAKAHLVVPSERAAGLIAAEWDSQAEEIDPASMPVTRLANTAIDGVAQEQQAVLEDIVRFAVGDLVFYRAAYPETLVEAQRGLWDPVLDFIAARTGARFETVEGISPLDQPAGAVKLFSAALGAYDEPLRLSCLHTMTTLTGSALIAFALAEGEIDLDTAWKAAHVDEDHNIAHWGEDFEAAKRRETRFAEMKAAADLLVALS
ncbi:MAG: ATPase [Nitratireductor sp.]|nr:ATPase [Nitratireductor sp.]